MNLFTLASWLLGIVGTLGVGGTVVAVVFFPTVAVPILEKIVAALLGCKNCLIASAFVVAVLGAYWYGHHGEYRKGYDAALSDIAQEDTAAIERATQMRGVWKDCRLRSGEWDQSTGECR